MGACHQHRNLQVQTETSHVDIRGADHTDRVIDNHELGMQDGGGPIEPDFHPRCEQVFVVGALGQGIQQAQDYDYGLWRRSEVLPDGRYAICEFSFSFEAPSGESFYTIALGNSNRGDFTLSEGELSEGIALILGSP